MNVIIYLHLMLHNTYGIANFDLKKKIILKIDFSSGNHELTL